MGLRSYLAYPHVTVRDTPDIVEAWFEKDIQEAARHGDEEVPYYDLNSVEFQQELKERQRKFIGRALLVSVVAPVVLGTTGLIGVKATSGETVDANFASSAPNKVSVQPLPAKPKATAKRHLAAQAAPTPLQRVIASSQPEQSDNGKAALRQQHDQYAQQVATLKAELKAAHTANTVKSQQLAKYEQTEAQLQARLAATPSQAPVVTKVVQQKVPVYTCVAPTSIDESSAAIINCDPQLLKNAHLNKDGKPYAYADVITMLTQLVANSLPTQPLAPATESPSASPSNVPSEGPSASPDAVPNPTDSPSAIPPPSPEAAAAGKINIMSMNVLGSEFAGHAQKRAEDSVHFALSHGAQVLTTVEMQKDQFGYFHEAFGSDWSSWPDNTTDYPGDAYKRSVFYDKTQYTQLDQGFTMVPGYSAENLSQLTDAMPWVLLQDKLTKQQYLIQSMHLVAEERAHTMKNATGLDAMGALKRERQAEILGQVNTGFRKKFPNATVTFAGDTNMRGILRYNQSPNDDAYHGNRNRIVECIFARAGLELAQNAASNLHYTGCANQKVQIDQQYVAGDHIIKVIFTENYSNNTAVSGTDHYFTPDIEEETAAFN